ncbi:MULTISPECIES: hypothetical protein [Sulfurovum]|uniref:Uncharacterized protein n=1 Tax=Sulfurovum xiamenensis TaxID=3019066 RepID=A0ABT7QUD7_9BACT|nr:MULTISPECIES: hypothetical protein [Sulfurovum]EIF51863.1 hypothetical protein SULAR_00110 [Sulfurovum sp. AR]MDM5264641.1 hypothetical protein [Sulfurovum xiamenensis]
MKKIIVTAVAFAALLTNVQADFSFGEMFEDMKQAALTLTKDSQETSVKVSAQPKTTEDSKAKHS